ncbi:hypothetical protein MICA_1910 [Micavibrio aeruginosavorus ARL-13]|uniref:Uncharacterized protein n=1 Tax=Micavibrio aeruginosavorus (strain ARL-13) TaxID=856793 RepID=G2KMC5_MICAA|nr:hypothetical protein MICA_1910 [Micavibrio aeruginosavorus ARL-13]
MGKREMQGTLVKPHQNRFSPDPFRNRNTGLSHPNTQSYPQIDPHVFELPPSSHPTPLPPA